LQLKTAKDVAMHCLVRATARHGARWDGDEEGKTKKNSDKNMLQCHRIHKEPHIWSRGIETQAVR